MSLDRISPKKIQTDNNFYLTLGLIRNDIGDLIYLQKLHSLEKNKLKLDGSVTPEVGRSSGRDIYIFRLALSQLYSTFEFLRGKKFRKFSDSFVKVFFEKNLGEYGNWDHLMLMAEYVDDGKIQDVDEIISFTKEERDIMRLMISARHDITYHYYGSFKWIGEGFRRAFENSEEENTKFAYVTEEKNVYIDRSYYVDLSIQKYLESKVGDENLLLSKIDPMLDILKSIGLHITLLLDDYHRSIKE